MTNADMKGNSNLMKRSFPYNAIRDFYTLPNAIKVLLGTKRFKTAIKALFGAQCQHNRTRTSRCPACGKASRDNEIEFIFGLNIEEGDTVIGETKRKYCRVFFDDTCNRIQPTPALHDYENIFTNRIEQNREAASLHTLSRFQQVLAMDLLPM